MAKRSAVPTVTHALKDVSIVQIVGGDERHWNGVCAYKQSYLPVNVADGHVVKCQQAGSLFVVSSV
jgi:hypothetical protein